MKKKIANQSLVILILVVCFGLFQAWKESKNPFTFFTNHTKRIEKPNYVSDKSFESNITEDNMVKRNFNE